MKNGLISQFSIQNYILRFISNKSIRGTISLSIFKDDENL